LTDGPHASHSLVFEYSLRLGDNALVLGQRLAEWCGHAPLLEEDIALTNIALDLIGQARLWLSYAGEAEGRGRDEDQLAFLRDGGQFRNVLLVEQPNGNFADTMARQFYFDTWHYFLLQALSASSDPRIAEIASKSFKEVAYHVKRDSDWIVRLGDGTEESQEKMQAAIDDLWRYTGELFEMDELEHVLMAEGVACDLQALHSPWLAHVEETLHDAKLRLPPATGMLRGGKRGVHSEHLGHMLATMQSLQRAYPGATW
jgi:ring-1,2-phenylacetyl-CoA epoxidase subunit PaaC